MRLCRRTFPIIRSGISIHAPLAGCDTKEYRRTATATNFNPRTPCGVRLGAGTGLEPISHFNPRTPCGVRRLPSPNSRRLHHFNPRTPCGVRLFTNNFRRTHIGFQSTHPLRGATCSETPPQAACLRFQSTHPLRGATPAIAQSQISAEFQSTHPLRGATSGTRSAARAFRFQSTHPLRGATNCPQNTSQSPLFQSTHPLRGATADEGGVTHGKAFQSTHPLRGATAKMHKIFCAFCDNRQFYRVSPSGVPSVGALFTYSRGLQRAGAGANLPVNGCALGLRAKSSASPQAGRSACSRSVRFYSRTSCRGNKTAGCRVPGP